MSFARQRRRTGWWWHATRIGILLAHGGKLGHGASLDRSDLAAVVDAHRCNKTRQQQREEKETAARPELGGEPS